MILYLVIGTVVFLPSIPILMILPLGTGDTGPASGANLMFVLFLNVSFLLAARIVLKWIDRKPPALLGLNLWFSSLKELSLGLAIGLANFGIVILALLAFGWISIEWTGIRMADADVFSLHLGTFLVFAAFEELINRGYLFQTLCEGMGIWAAAIIINMIFSLVHVINPAFSMLAGAFLFIHGLLYTIVYLKTRSLWTPIGLHLAWNLAQGPLAGMKVSGTPVDTSLFLTEVTGPDLYTGGGFGIEGGLVAILLSVVILLALLKARWLSPSRRFLLIERKWRDRDSDEKVSSAGG